MKKYILIMLFTLAGLAGMAQTNEPLPGDAEPLTNQLYLSPSDSTVWAADPFSGLAIKVGTWFKVDSLFKEGYTTAQVDSALSSNIWHRTEFNKYRFDGFKQVSPNGINSASGKMARLPSGGLVHVYRGTNPGTHSSGNGALMGLSTLDSGRTWSSPFVIYDDGDWDDRQEAPGNAPDGRLVIIFAKADTLTGARMGLFSINSTDGINWSSPVEIGSGITDWIPFGQLYTRGSEMFALFYRTGECVMYKSTDNGQSWGYLKNIYTQANLVEPYMLDIPGEGSIILARNDDTSPTNVSIYQFSSADGLNFTLDGATNINDDIGYSAHVPSTPILFGGKVVVFASRRFSYTTGRDEKNIAATTRIYAIDPTDVIGNPLGYTIINEINRPLAGYLSMGGYVSGIVQDSTYVAIMWDRKYAGDWGATAQEDSRLFAFRLNIMANNHDYLSSPSVYGGKRVQNIHNGGFDYVVTHNDVHGFTDAWPPLITGLNPAISGGNADELGSVTGTNFTFFNSASTNLPTSNGYFINTIRSQGTNNVFQQAYGWDVDRVFFRRFNAVSQTDVPWLEYWHKGNLSNPMTTSGGTFNAGITINYGGFSTSVLNNRITFGRSDGSSYIDQLPGGSIGLRIGTTTYYNQSATLAAFSTPVSATQYRLSSMNTAPSSASATGITGEIRVTSDFIYICIATNTWVRTALTTW